MMQQQTTVTTMCTATRETTLTMPSVISVWYLTTLCDIAPILTNRCAIAKCHVVDGPHDIDLRTYDSVIKGGDEGAIVIAGDAMESEMVEEIAEGKMPPEGPPLEAAQIQLIIDWINEGAENN
jgi:hypothetical protein